MFNSLLFGNRHRREEQEGKNGKNGKKERHLKVTLVHRDMIHD